MTTHLWLRCETKPFEHRCALTPTTARQLLEKGFLVSVERDPQRIFTDQEFEEVGCTLVDHNSWPSAPSDALIIGLKELPEDSSPLKHTHIHFAHCYKEQANWRDVLSRFPAGGGELYDLEFLEDPVTKRRVAAFGYHAGFAGAAVGLLSLARQVSGEKLGKLTPYSNESEMVEHVKKEVNVIKQKLNRLPRVMVMGALGRCGRGAVDLCEKVGLSHIVKWDMAETAKGGPFSEILEVDLFINCIYLSSKIPSFVTVETIKDAGSNRTLRTVVDVSCDTTNPNNPIPIYTINTTFSEPTVAVQVQKGEPELEVISIDHLPTLLPREASEAFSRDLLPSLLQLPNRDTAPVWTEAAALFKRMCKQL